MLPKGFRISSAEAAIKKPGRKDIALIFSQKPSVASAVFTKNMVAAAPVLLGKERIKSGLCQAVLVNSGNANACTGEKGFADALESSELVAKALGILPELVQVSSTGVIGVPLPMSRILPVIPTLSSSLGEGGIDDLASAIMTTDTFPKIATRKVDVGGVICTMTGVAKGAGMIMPDMATMLSYLLTDAAVEKGFLDKAFRRAVDASFNSITVDGDMSTNDTALVLANGFAGNLPIVEGSESAKLFEDALSEILLELAKMIVKDGEGATKLVTVIVKGALTESDAEKAARAIANSSLVKTAFYGQDANWGRIFAAAGYSGAQVDQTKTSLYFDDVRMVENGIFAGGDAEERGSEVLKKKEFCVTVDLNLGSYKKTIYTSDLTHEYVSINADYRT